MSRWVAVPAPVAELVLEEPGETVDVEGNKITHYRTRYGVRYAKVVEPGGFVLWLQEMP